MIPLIIKDQFYTIQNLQRSPIPQTCNWPGTFFAVSDSKPALVEILGSSFNKGLIRDLLMMKVCPFRMGMQNLVT